MWEDIIYYYGAMEIIPSHDNDDNSDHDDHDVSAVCKVHADESPKFTDIQFTDIQSTTSSVILTNYSYTNNAVNETLPTVILEYEAPLIVQTNSSQPAFATCQFKNYPYSAHLPHYMQQLYRCWSFWRNHSDKLPVMVTTHKKSTHYRRAMQRPFTSGLMKLLPQMGIQVLDVTKLPKQEPLPVENSTTTTTAATTTTAIHNNTNDSSVSCVTVGPLHAPEDTAFQVRSISDMQDLRNRVLSALLLNDTASSSGCQEISRPDRSSSMMESNSSSTSSSTTATSTTTRFPRIAILNRRQTRKIVNAKDIVKNLRLHLDNNIEIPELYFEGLSFRDQVRALSNIDILITPHGAQETGLVFLPTCGGVLELIPNGYYYPNFFGTLAATSGLSHAFLYFGGKQNNNDVSYSWNNMTIRSANFCPSIHIIRTAVEALMDQWQRCCDRLLME
jgi:hypothetical protein